MAQGDDAQDTAAARLRHLDKYFREHPVTGPVEGHSASRSTPAPLSLATLDHIQASVHEVVELTREANPQAGPTPSRVDAVYDWCREHTEHADEAVQQRRETIEYRQYLEHAIRAGDVKVVRSHRCPSCGTVGLLWHQAAQRARCINRHCARRNGGISRAWTLASLAHEHIASNESLKECAT